ncbi:TonB-dependent receptor [Patiriisocius marinistellae]|uniref:TonB-dependent receptor n=1 Tax=Patiriisocius marinistellae TaxID=2494560 RepID=A0A5J4FXE1_9FLAO|nr:TonB-dependent receptor [Patiriisocius marinistellae]GEQ84715.1 TonB-dependent receptor [Patiriisocius marinistellae]
MKKLLLITFMAIAGMATSFAQGTVTGTVVDADLGGALPGANVLVNGTTNGTITDFDGNFKLEVANNNGTLTLSYVGFTGRTVNYTIKNGVANLGSINITPDAASLDEVIIVGSGIIQVAEGRQTPVAVSTIREEEIRLKVSGNAEFTESFKNTPSVYVANQGGGFGDSQVFLRGFDDTNTAFLLNGQPINGQEDGRMYWSNWSGMSDVANAVQVQRGLGASKLAISSVGGTVNIISKTTDKKQGGSVRILGGNDSYFKGTVSYDSGLNENGWAFSVLLDHWQAHKKYAFGTEGQGQNYLFAVGYQPSERSSFNFLLTGAPQYHDQNFGQSEDTYKAFGGRYNPNSGFLDGERFTERRNYYHKPVANLNWDYEINDKTDLATVVYASWGRGGGTGGLGRGRVRNEYNDNIPGVDPDEVTTEIDFEQIRDNNLALEGGIGEFGNSYARRASVNNHNWYGLLSNLNYEANENLNLSIGVDGRLYKGTHFYQINDLLGLSGYNDNFRTDRPDGYVFQNEYDADPWSALFDYANEANRTQFDYDENINYVGGFGQAEYATDRFSAFVQGAVSTQSFQRTGRFTGNTIDGVDGLGESEKINKLGYNAKGGVGYSINEASTFFANVGYYSKQPYLDNIFADIRNSNALVQPDVDNEEIFSYEAGYRYKKGNFRLNVDVYRTKWGNRFLSQSGRINGDPDNGIPDVFYTDRFTDLTQIHQGLEFDFEYRPDSDRYRLKGYGSLGNWKYDGSTPVTRQDNDTFEFLDFNGGVTEVDLTGTKVGRAPQTSFGAGLVLKVCEGLSVDGDYNVYTDIYAQVDPDDVVDEALAGNTFQANRLSAFGLLDVGFTYKFNFSGNKLTLRGNVYNATNEAYISSQNNFGNNLGTGRTYNASLRYAF